MATDALLVVALKTDQPNIARRLQTILAAAEPVTPDTEPCAWAKPVEELVASDLDALAVLVGCGAVSRLRVGEVAASGLPASDVDGGTGDGPHPEAADPLAAQEGEKDA